MTVDEFQDAAAADLQLDRRRARRAVDGRATPAATRSRCSTRCRTRARRIPRRSWTRPSSRTASPTRSPACPRREKLVVAPLLLREPQRSARSARSSASPSRAYLAAAHEGRPAAALAPPERGTRATTTTSDREPLPRRGASTTWRPCPARATLTWRPVRATLGLARVRHERLHGRRGRRGGPSSPIPRTTTRRSTSSSAARARFTLERRDLRRPPPARTSSSPTRRSTATPVALEPGTTIMSFGGPPTFEPSEWEGRFFAWGRARAAARRGDPRGDARMPARGGPRRPRQRRGVGAGIRTSPPSATIRTSICRVRSSSTSRGEEVGPCTHQRTASGMLPSLGHRGSGKTSLHEALLFQAGAINRLGSGRGGLDRLRPRRGRGRRVRCRSRRA